MNTNGEAKARRRRLGAQGERLAAEHLEAEGYRIVAQNWRCRSGELDIVAEQGGVLVFVEVRSRRLTGTFGTPEESVDFRKRKQVRETAQLYLYRHKAFGIKARFDVITVTFSREGAFFGLNHVENAF